MFIREGGLKHYTDIQSNNILMSLSVDYNLHNEFLFMAFGYFKIYYQFGYGKCIFKKETLI